MKRQLETRIQSYLGVQSKCKLGDSTGDFVEVNRFCSAISLYNVHTHPDCFLYFSFNIIEMERNANKYCVMLCVDCGIMSRKLASEEHGRGQNMVGFLFYGLLHLGFPVNELKKRRDVLFS